MPIFESSLLKLQSFFGAPLVFFLLFFFWQMAILVFWGFFSERLIYSGGCTVKKDYIPNLTIVMSAIGRRRTSPLGSLTLLRKIAVNKLPTFSLNFMQKILN